MTPNIPEKDISSLMSTLEITREEAIQLWLEDHQLSNNQEQQALQEKASDIKLSSLLQIDHERKPRTRKEDKDKHELFSYILNYLSTIITPQVLVKDKLITFEWRGSTYKLDLIKTRQPKGE